MLDVLMTFFTIVFLLFICGYLLVRYIKDHSGPGVDHEQVSEIRQKHLVEAKKKYEINQAKVSALMNSEKFVAHQKHIQRKWESDLEFIAVDADRNLLMIGHTSIYDEHKKINGHAVHANKIISVTLLNDAGDAVSQAFPQSQSTKRILGGAAIGGLAFGGAGAVVGAIAGSKVKNPTAEQLNEQAVQAAKAAEGKRLFVGLNDLKNPHLEITFKTSDKAREWYNLVEILIYQNNNDSGKN